MGWKTYGMGREKKKEMLTHAIWWQQKAANVQKRL